MASTSPLQEVHEELGARFVDFGGWSMPEQYEGVLAEHAAVRSSAGVFDVSHLGRFQYEGPSATAILRDELCNDVASVEPGRAQYTMALTESGGIVDDIIVLRINEESYWVLPNGANYEAILERFEGSVSVTPRRHDSVMLAVQGPDAPDIVEQVLGASPGTFRWLDVAFEGHEILISGTGYTGERGAELIAPITVASSLFRSLIEAGAKPCGLGARDTLRLEMGYALWGQDLDIDTSPIEAGLGWVIDWDHEFVGRAALEAQREIGLSKELIGFTTPGRQAARHGYPARSSTSAGHVTSGSYSPTLEHGIGMAYLAPPPQEDDQIEVEIRGTWHQATRKKPPFLDR